MNCKPGDLAIVVSAPSKAKHHIGKIIECVHTRVSWDGKICWQLKHPWKDPKFPGWTLQAIADDDLRPIRDNPGQDETLTWAPVSDKVTP